MTYVGTALAAAVGGIAVWSVLSPDPVILSTTSFDITPPANTPLWLSPWEGTVAISPDGEYVVYLVEGDAQPAGPPGLPDPAMTSTRRQLLIRPLAGLDASPLGGRNPRSPFVSPDGNWA